ncbi:methylenetetrahydrofolate reductase [Paracoccus aminophilus]|uniref:Methylenetetrahydrofolate reductase (NADPH) n=1 Tax=Paracoccus aminophilus JCM 7686 TaxID=1367847 RepID=S5XT76_PARAH|nr:methylenetetrahydrofolate reductase (NAD(P)H) [Paracoccus aminophilus]AGT10684.1 methylenetetrahydrofolate reductase (NADPH) [Paracoccus aminophilus JCM 7686]
MTQIPDFRARPYSIELTPAVLAKTPDLSASLPPGTRVYLAHLGGGPIAEMVAAARRIAEAGFPVMPHFPAREIADARTLADWIARYQGEADVREALLIAGGRAAPVGDYHSSLQLLESGAFQKAGFRRLHIAGHPEGNTDIDPKGGFAQTDAALRLKSAFAGGGTEMAIVTQFVFEAVPVMDWVRRLRGQGIDLPIHLGVPGPAKLQSLLRFALSCGIGPSVRVLRRRARDLTRLLLPYEANELIEDLSQLDLGAAQGIAQLHLFPFGGVKPAADWAARVLR